MAIHKFFLLLLLAILNRAWATSFIIANNCKYNVWPGLLSNPGKAPLTTTGFQLLPGQTQTVGIPAAWAGRLWGRTGCTFDSSGKGNCSTADCGGSLECNGAGAIPPASLAEFSIGQGQTQDFYDVSLVDGYNLPMLITAQGGTGACTSTGCITDINLSCPKELQVDDGVGGSDVMACKSACDAFGDPAYCCSGAYGNPNTCKPSAYSQLFKTQCPRAYSYAYDDTTSTFTCASADYTITFCPTLAMASTERKSNTPAVADSPISGTSSNDNNTNPLYQTSATQGTSASSMDSAACRPLPIYSGLSLMIALIVTIIINIRICH